MSDPESSAKGASDPQSSKPADELSSNPLFGASPPADASSSKSTPQPPSPQTSESNSIKAESGLSGIGSDNRSGSEVINEPLYGATPPREASGTGSSSPTGEVQVQQHDHTAREESVPRRYVVQHGGHDGGPGNGLYSRQPTTIPHAASPYSSPRALTFLRRLAFVLSVVLGVSASIAGIWSYFILPLLHSSFSARKAILDQQVPRYQKLLEGLRGLRSNKLYGPLRVERPSPSDESEKEQKVDDRKRSTIRREASLKEITSSASISMSSSSSQNHHDTNADANADTDADITQPTLHEPLVPLSSLQNLSTNLNSLTSALDNTSTTRTSLISTLESYTSHLHREMFVSRAPGLNHGFRGGSGFGGYSIGGTLGANLSRASGSAGAGEEGGIRAGNGEEWDSVRKEIRAIKGLLLNRRAFAQPVK
ncbi:hypothetical protein IAT40_007949 [Kwoniella sp. CBS 6097]